MFQIIGNVILITVIIVLVPICAIGALVSIAIDQIRTKKGKTPSRLRKH